MDQARKGAAIIRETLAKKKLKSNHGKSRYVLLGSAQFKAKTRRRQKKPQRGWEAILWEKSPDEKYLGDMVHTG